MSRWTWEYKVMTDKQLDVIGRNVRNQPGFVEESVPPVSFLEYGLNRLGRKGWKLVTKTNMLREFEYIFKRKVL